VAAGNGFIQKHGDRYGVDWRQLSSPESFFATARLVTEIAAVRKVLRGRLLDIGCGTKPYQVMTEGLVDEHLGIDVPQSMHTHSAIDVYASAGSLPFASESFDSILCTEVLEHTSDPVQVCREIARVLRPGGAAIVSTPFMYRIHERPYDFFRYTPYSYEVLAKRSGLTIETLTARGGYFTVLLDYLLKGAALWVSAINSIVNRRSTRSHLLMTRPVRFLFYIMQAPLVWLLGRERVKSDTYTLGYVVVLRKPPAGTQVS